MSLSTVAFGSGLSSLIIVLIGWILGLYLLKRYFSSPDTNTLALAVILISVGSVWLVIAINFLLALNGSAYLDSLPYLFIVGWIPGVVGLATGYVFISIVKEEYLKPVMFLFGLFFVINTVVIYVLIPFNILGFKVDSALQFSDLKPGELPNASTQGIFQILSVISILIMLATAIFFIITAIRTTIPLVKARAGLLGIGLLMVSILITFDTLIEISDLLILLTVRVVIVIALFILAMAITLPKRIFKNLT